MNINQKVESVFFFFRVSFIILTAISETLCRPISGDMAAERLTIVAYLMLCTFLQNQDSLAEPQRLPL